MPFAAILIQFAISYLMSRLTQPNGPRLTDLSAGFGDYGVALGWLFGSSTRSAGVVLAADDIKETVHKHKPVTDYLFGLVGALLPSVKTYTYSITLAIFLADRTHDEPIEDLLKLYAGGKIIFNSAHAPIVSETFDGDGRLIRRKYGKSKYCTSVTVHGGGFDQVADPILNSVIGPQPGYRGWAYAVIEDLQLKDFGNAPPMPIEALTKVKTNESLASVCESICAAAGIDTVRDLSSSALNDLVVRGYSVTSEVNCWDALKPLLPAFAVDAAEVAGQIRFYRRSQTLRGTILPADMGGHVFGDSPPQSPLEVQRTPDVKLPRETALTFVDPAREYQPNTASAKSSEGSAESNVSANVQLVLTADEGATTAALMHWDARLGRSPARFTVTDKWNCIEPGLAYALPIADRYVPHRITLVRRGANGLCEVEAVSDEAVTYTAAIVGSSGNPPPTNSTLFPDTRVVAIDGSILLDEDDEYGFYVTMAGTDPDWSSGRIEGSLDGIAYLTLVDSSDSAIIGDVTGTLAAGPTTGLDDTLDTVSVLTVELLHSGMELISVTDADLDTFANLAFVGSDGLGEYLQFKTATQIDDVTWELTNLRRGRKGSDWAIAAHVPGEEFVLLTEGGRFRLPASTLDSWGVPISLRGVTFNQDEVDAGIVAFTNTGEGKRPYSPVDVEGSWDGSNNLTITWAARSRMNAGGLGIDDQFNFEVEITSGTGRTINAVGVEAAAYSAADQTTDTITPGDSISGRVRQLSDVNDGRWRNFTLVGPNDALFDTTHTSFDSTALTWDAA
jgi:hypothetical protein